MSGLYIHIPFCRKSCNYCDFYFTTKVKTFEDSYVEALLKEIEKKKQFLHSTQLTSLYLGGGTPSLLSSKHLIRIYENIKKHFDISNLSEFTIEVNPEDINAEKIQTFKTVGINRLSIGIQTFIDKDLAWMNRSHCKEDVIKAIKLSQDAGLSNISGDLIFGYPSLKESQWIENLEQIVKLKIPHISCYALTVEKKTRLYKEILRKKTPSIDDHVQANCFTLADEFLERNGYEHYEISNYAQSGKRAIHNYNYWEGKEYIGLGPSAHSYFGNIRQWNTRDIKEYIENINSDTIFYSEEVLEDKDLFNEFVMLRLRTKDGIPLQVSENQFDSVFTNHLKRELQNINPTHINIENNHIKLSKSGLLYADAIASQLFYV